MHELGIVFHIIDSIEAVGKENKLDTVSKVTLEIGEVSGVVDTYLTDCWKWASDKSLLLKGSELFIEPIVAETICEDCDKTYPTLKFAKVCPYCNGNHTHLLTGNEINIKEIEAC
jgi:hydrogenase nickel incorporation protein HypA/HybF